MFFTGWLDNSILPSVGVGVLFITIERCIIIKFPTKYGVKIQHRLFALLVVIWVVTLIVNGTSLMLEMPQTAFTGNYGIGSYIGLQRN